MHLLLRSKHIAPKPRIAQAPELVSFISKDPIVLHITSLLEA